MVTIKELSTYLSGRVKHDLAIGAVPEAQLLAEDNEGAVCAVAQKDVRLGWTKHDFTTIAMIRCYCAHMVVQVQL